MCILLILIFHRSEHLLFRYATVLYASYGLLSIIYESFQKETQHEATSTYTVLYWPARLHNNRASIRE